MASNIRAKGRQCGQGLAEFAIVLPFFLVMLVGMVDVGRAVWANNAVANAAREAARYAAVHGGTKSNTCPVGPPGPKTVVPATSVACPFPSPSKQSIRDTALQYMIAGGTGIAVTVCYSTTSTTCTDDTDAAGATNVRGVPVTVVVSSRIPMIMGSLLGVGTINVSGTSTMLVNH